MACFGSIDFISSNQISHQNWNDYLSFVLSTNCLLFDACSTWQKVVNCLFNSKILSVNGVPNCKMFVSGRMLYTRIQNKENSFSHCGKPLKQQWPPCWEKKKQYVRLYILMRHTHVYCLFVYAYTYTRIGLMRWVYFAGFAIYLSCTVYWREEDYKWITQNVKNKDDGKLFVKRYSHYN